MRSATGTKEAAEQGDGEPTILLIRLLDIYRVFQTLSKKGNKFIS
jgi:hypothetical protein